MTTCSDLQAQRSLGAVHAAAQLRAVVPFLQQFSALHGKSRPWPRHIAASITSAEAPKTKLQTNLCWIYMIYNIMTS